MPLDEFGLIQRFFTRAPLLSPGASSPSMPTLRTSPSVVLGVGDDAALVAPSPGMQLAISADTLVEGRHFFTGTDPYALGWKSLAVNLSDLAAMSASPRWFTLCLTLPAVDEDWLTGFARGLFALADAHGVALIGGDTTAGPPSISIQIIGEVAPGAALRRDGAKAGDDIWLSGPTGAAALAVQYRLGNMALADDELAHCAARLDFPEPRVALGRALAGLASAAIDVSDGLVADVGHIAARSGLAAQIYLPALLPAPLHATTLASRAWQTAQLGGGDDYELCFTAPVSARGRLDALATAHDWPLARIGSMLAGSGATVLDASGQPLPLSRGGFNHFA